MRLRPFAETAGRGDAHARVVLDPVPAPRGTELLVGTLDGSLTCIDVSDGGTEVAYRREVAR